MWNPWLSLLKAFGEGGARRVEVDPGQLAALPQRYEQFDMTLAWEVTASSDETVVEGVLKNVRYAHMEGVEVWIAALDPMGIRLARSVCFVIPHQVRLDEFAHFEVKLPVLLAPGTRLQFTYKYRGSDGGDGGTDWMQSFDSVVPER